MIILLFDIKNTFNKYKNEEKEKINLLYKTSQ
jgi:hypothetical protein